VPQITVTKHRQAHALSRTQDNDSANEVIGASERKAFHSDDDVAGCDARVLRRRPVIDAQNSDPDETALEAAIDDIHSYPWAIIGKGRHMLGYQG